MPMSPYHTALASDLSRFWLTGALPDGSELKALAEHSHRGDIMQAVVHAAAQITHAMLQESVSSPDDVLFIEHNENTGEMAMSRLYALPAYYGKDFEDEDLCLFSVLDQAMEDHGGELAPIQQTSRPLTRDDTPDRCSIRGWFANKIAA